MEGVVLEGMLAIVSSQKFLPADVKSATSELLERSNIAESRYIHLQPYPRLFRIKPRRFLRASRSP
jgi:hypothetical protein